MVPGTGESSSAEEGSGGGGRGWGHPGDSFLILLLEDFHLPVLCFLPFLFFFLRDPPELFCLPALLTWRFPALNL